MSKNNLSMAVTAVLSVVCLVGCGAGAGNADGAASSSGQGGPVPTAPVGSSAEGKAIADSARVENLVADCMKAHGFNYVPSPQQPANGEASPVHRNPALVPYGQLKELRQKYGFGYFSAFIFPNDPNVARRDMGPASPNEAIKKDLDPAQRKVYEVTLNGTPVPGQGKSTTGGCYQDSYTKVHGSVPAGNPAEEQAKSATAEQVVEAFRSDKQAIQAAQGYASCLKNGGYTVTSTAPGDVENTVQLAASGLFQTARANGANIDAAAAKQGLADEIKMALDDLECGKAYEVIAKPFVENLMKTGQG
ncbi:hypothetical protein [Amycolatopsis sp. NPDC051061]|uniref:hypothetical protein n=1 Tax=Amycolatopsis sp. NPDC051061 TaxID=3155042 RepID=UPI00344335F8